MSYTKTKGTSVTLGLEATVNAPPPFDGIGVSRSISTTVSTSESKTNTKSESIDIKEVKHLSLPANTTVWYQTVIYQTEYTSNWRGNYCMHEYAKNLV
eukprot:UN03640